MHGMSNHRLRFRLDDEHVFITQGNNIVEHFPDWVANDPYFEANRLAGRITVFNDEPILAVPDLKKPKKRWGA